MTWAICETAFAFGGGHARRFGELDVPGLSPNQWGWTNGPFDKGVQELELRAADPGKLDMGILVGMLYVVYYGSTATFVYDINDNHAMEEVHLYVGSEPLPRDNQGNSTVVPREYPCTHGKLGGVADHTFVVNNLSGPIYVVAHAIVRWRQ